MFLVLLLPGIPSILGATGLPNLLANPGFEDAIIQAPGWNLATPIGTASAVTPYSPRNGENALLVAGAGGYGAVARSARVPIAPGSDLLAQGWFDDVSASSDLGLAVYDAAGNVVFWRSYGSHSAPSWELLGVNFRAPANAAQAEVVATANGATQFLFDDASLQALPPLMSEPFSSRNAWTSTGAGSATIDCARRVTGCSLAVDAACCSATFDTRRDLSLDLTKAVEVGIPFYGSSPTGDTDVDVEVLFAEGHKAVMKVTDGPAALNNGVSLQLSTSQYDQRFWTWGAGSWQAGVFLLDPVANTVTLEIRTIDQTTVLARSATFPLPPGGSNISGIQLRVVDHGGASVVYNVDDIWIGETI